MPHAFDGCNFEQILADSKLLVALARSHEHTLAGVVAVLESSDARLADLSEVVRARAYTESAMAPEASAPDLPALIRASCVEARQQRELAERIRIELLGDLGAENGRPRVLIVDDAEDNRELTATVLESSGFHAVTAANGLEGVIAAHCLRPAAVLMDVTMPVLDGIEAARLLKASAATRSVKVIAYTANPEFYEGPLTRLFVGVLGKPASPETIVATVRQSVGSS